MSPRPVGRPRGTFVKLTERDFAEAVELYRLGSSLRTTAQMFGVSWQSLRGCMLRRGIELRPRPTWSGARNPKFNSGGNYVNADGYVIAYRGGKKVKRHRLIAEQTIGRELRPSEIVHHDDEDKTNNADTNLKVTTHSAHSRKHALERWSDPEWRMRTVAKWKAGGNTGMFKPGQNRH